MGVTIEQESGDIGVVCISGLLKRAEWEAAQAAAKSKLQDIDSIQMLVILEDFKDWDKDEGWGNMDFYLEFREKIT